MQVFVYTTPTCAFCQITKDFLKEHGVDFKEINVAADQNAAREMISKTGQMGVPVTLIIKDGQEEYIVGFDEARLSKLISPLGDKDRK